MIIPFDRRFFDINIVTHGKKIVKDILKSETLSEKAPQLAQPY